VIRGPLVVGSRSWGHTQQEPENISFLASTVANKLFSAAAFFSTQTFVLSYRCLFNGRSETGTYDSESELTEEGLDETDRLTPRPREHHHHRHHRQGRQQLQQSRGVPLGTDSRDDSVSNSDDSVRSLYTHTHPFNGPFSGITRVSRYQKGKINLDFTEARDSEWQWHQLGYMQDCTSLQTDNHASTPPLSFFTGRMPFLPPNQQHQSTEGTQSGLYILGEMTSQNLWSRYLRYFVGITWHSVWS